MPDLSIFRVPAIVWLLLLAGLGFAGYWRYDHTHISSDLRQTLTEAVTPASTESDILADLHTAQSQIHTTRDAEVEAMLQRSVLLTQSAALAILPSSLPGNAISASRDLRRYLALERQYKRQRKPVPQALKDSIQQATQQEAQQQPSATEELNQQVSREDSAEAAQLFQQLRATLGLPPLPPK